MSAARDFGPHPAQEAALELGFHLRPSFWGQGLATEAALAVLEYAFSTLGIETIFAGHHPSNDASRRVLGKIGFVYVGDEFYAPSGVMEPIYVFRQEDWRSLQK
jgi:RimJ/RimL family protein N-acetyltransferase